MIEEKSKTDCVIIVDLKSMAKKRNKSVYELSKETGIRYHIVKKYYQNEVYAGDFIEEVVIFDGLNLDNEFLIMAENELMIESKVYKKDIDKLLNNMMIREICNEL